MATPVTGSGVTSGRGGSIKMVLEPPVEFILKQSGAFRHGLVMEMDEMYEDFKPVLAAMEESQWSSRGRGQWPPLAPTTRNSGEMMVRSGDLKGSLTDPNRAMKIRGVNAEYGTSVPYAIYHQDGGSTPGRPPQRQVIPDPIPVEIRRELEQKQVAWVDRLALRTFGRI